MEFLASSPLLVTFCNREPRHPGTPSGMVHCSRRLFDGGSDQPPVPRARGCGWWIYYSASVFSRRESCSWRLNRQGRGYKPACGSLASVLAQDYS